MTQPTVPPTLLEVSGHEVVTAYGDVAAEYAALRQHSGLVDRRHRGRMRMTGERAAETLTGLVTNDVEALTAGHGCYAAALTPKGKIIADVRIHRDDEGLLIDVPARAWDGWRAMIRKFVNPRLAAWREVTSEVWHIGLFGPESRRVLESVTRIGATALGALPPYGNVVAEVEGARVLVARSPELGGDGFDLFVTTGESADSIRALRERATDAGAVPVGSAAWDIARIEAGYPEWGIDIDDATIPQEGNLEELQAISYTKGCYTGQEVVARIHFRGHVNRRLVGLRSAGTEPPPQGAVVTDLIGKQVGDVRSTASSPRLGGIALAMVRREVETGAAVTAKWVGGELPVTVSPLPFLG